MRLETIDSDEWLVFLDGRWCRGAFAADDVAGWVEIVDASKLPPLDLNRCDSVEDGEVQDWEVVQTCRKYGKIEIKKLSK